MILGLAWVGDERSERVWKWPAEEMLEMRREGGVLGRGLELPRCGRLHEA